MTTLLAVEGLAVAYGRHVAVRSFDLTVEPGATLAIVGESGSGKSSVARAIVGLTPVSAGRVLLRGQDVTTAKARKRASFARHVQMIFQDPTSSLNPRMTIDHALREAISTHRHLTNSELAAEVSRLLGVVALDPAITSRYPVECSGGQRQRVAIARALAVQPSVIIADEVTSALDVSVQGAIVNLLREIQRSLGIAMVMITHNLAVARYCATETVVMRAGEVVERAGPELYDAPSHPYTKNLLAVTPSLPARAS